MAPESRKKSKGTRGSSDPSNVLLTALTTLLASLADLRQAFAAADESPAPGTALPKLAEALIILGSFEQALHNSIPSDVASELPRAWQDDLDREGVELWNRSTAIRCSIGTQGSSNEDSSCRETVAQLRQLAFKLILLGAVQPLTLESHLALLSLATKAALAATAADDTPSTDLLLSAAAEHSEFVTPPDREPGAPTSSEARALVAFHTARIRASIRIGNVPIATWMMGKLKEFRSAGILGPREVDQSSAETSQPPLTTSDAKVDGLAQLAFEIGSALVKRLDGPEQNNGGDVADTVAPNDANAAVDWLVWSTELSEGRKEQLSKELQIAALKTLAQAYIASSPPGSGWVKAENVLSEILTFEQNPTIWRRYLKLVIDRKGGDGELIEGFKNAALVVPLSDNEGVQLLAVMHRVGEDRHVLRLAILQAFAEALVGRLVTRISTPSTSTRTQIAPLRPIQPGDASVFAGQVTMAAAFLLREHDRDRFETILSTLGSAGIKLDSSVAFVATTYLWKFGDSCHRESLFADAAAWYLLGANPVMQVERTTWPKSLRKAALCFSEAEMYEKAEETMRRGIAAGVEDAKSHFVRFHNFTLKSEIDSATSALKSMIECPDFTLDMLLWASKMAFESRLKPLLTSVLGFILETCSTNPRNLEQVDLLVLLRSLVRLSVMSLDNKDTDHLEVGLVFLRHFSASLALATALAAQDTPPPKLHQNVSWLSKTGYNLCVRFHTDWDPQLLYSMYSTIADLMDLETKLSEHSDPGTLSKMWLCRFAALTSQVSEARRLESVEKIKAFHELLSPVRDLRDALLDALHRHPSLPRSEEIEASLVSLEIQVLVGVEDWSGVVDVLQTFQSSERKLPVKIIKSAAEQATSNSTCPPDIMFAILKTTLDVLFERREITTAGLASWFRVVITILLRKGAGGEALKYAGNVLDMIKLRRATYPKDEALWLCTQGWDHGVGLLNASSPQEGRHWCERAIEIAKLVDPVMAAKLESMFPYLCERFPLEVRM